MVPRYQWSFLSRPNKIRLHLSHLWHHQSWTNQRPVLPMYQPIRVQSFTVGENSGTSKEARDFKIDTELPVFQFHWNNVQIYIVQNLSGYFPNIVLIFFRYCPDIQILQSRYIPANTRDPCYFLSQKERRSPLGIENGGRVLNFMDINQ